MTPLIQHALDWVRSSIQPVAAFSEEELALKAESAAVVARVLRGSEGEAFLEVLAKLTVLRPPTDPRLTGPAGHEFVQRRTGENAVLGALVHLLDVHDHLTRKDHAPENPENPDLRAPFGWDSGPGLARYGGAGDPDAGGGGGFTFDEAGTVAVR